MHRQVGLGLLRMEMVKGETWTGKLAGLVELGCQHVTMRLHDTLIAQAHPLTLLMPMHGYTQANPSLAEMLYKQFKEKKEQLEVGTWAGGRATGVWVSCWQQCKVPADMLC